MKRTKKQAVESTPLANKPVTQTIEQRAYEIYVERGGDHGRDHEDWLQAEFEIKDRAEG